jgi:hypothetical protein
MKKYDLSILIPSRNEMFISNTVADILKNKRGNTEIIVGLDGAWADPGIPDHPDVKIVYVSSSLGQRGMTNALARLSRAKYLAKSDAHCAFDEGFDVKLMEVMQDDWTLVPTMRNLHAFDWKCMQCGKKTYQGPTPGTPNGITHCEDCGNKDNFKRKVLWYPKPSPQSKSYCFDPEPHFQYFKEFSKRPQGQGDITPTMSLQGSFFMLTREKYWSLNICDESFGSWGSQGIEVACKTWLTGGQVMCLQTTWYAHMFRTQGGDFSFPYEQKQSKVNEAKALAREKFFGGQIPGQLHPLSWLVEKFWPVYGWTDDDLAELKKSENKDLTKGILYFTDNELTLKVARPVQKRIKQIAQDLNMELVSSSRKPMDMGNNVVTREPRGYLTMFKQILKGLEAMESDVVFMAEHDVIYPEAHFDFIPADKDTFYYDQNWYRLHLSDGFIATWDADQVSGLCAYRETLINHYKERVATFDAENFNRKFEPGSGLKSEAWNAAVPYVDIRTGQNLTGNKRSLDDFRDKSTAKNFRVVEEIPGWSLKELEF